MLCWQVNSVLEALIWENIEFYAFFQRITIAEILEDEWFKKDYKPPHFEQNDDVSLEDVDAAFDSSEVIQSECRILVCSPNIYVLKASLMLSSFFTGTSCGGEKRETRIHECICSYCKVAGIQPWKFVWERDDGRFGETLIYNFPQIALDVSILLIVWYSW